MSRRRVAAAVATASVGGALGGALLLGLLGDDEEAGSKVTTRKQLNTVAQELVDRLADARQRDLHLVYEGALPAAEKGRLTVEVWWKDERARQSLVAQAPGRGRQEATAFVRDDGNVFCQRTDAVDWSCQRSPSTTSAGASVGIIDALVSSLEGKDVTAAETQVGDDKATCYTLDPASGDVLCLRDDDVPVKFTFAEAELVLAKVQTSVDDKTFKPPAEVQPGLPPATTARPVRPSTSSG